MLQSLDSEWLKTFILTYWKWAALTLIVHYVCKVLWVWYKRDSALPPGPRGFPVIGSTLALSDRSEIALMKMSWKYGPVVGLKLFNDYIVVLNDYDSIYEALIRQGTKFSGRPKNIMFNTFTEGHGIIAIDGAIWKENRKFSAGTMRSLGVGKKAIEMKIVEEALCMCDFLKSKKQEVFDPMPTVLHGIANVIAIITFGQRFEYEDKDFIKKAYTLVDWFAENSNAFMMIQMAPFLRFVPPFNFTVKSLMRARDKLYGILNEFVDEHKETYDDYSPRDLIDAFLKKIYENKNDPDTTYTEAELLGLLRDFFLAGTDTTSNALRWLLIYLVNRPTVQKKIQREIDRVIGADSYPKMEHMASMHYTKAVLWEVLRIRTPGPLGVAHLSTEEAVVNGYRIPKNTQVLTNMWAVHHDPRIWKNPEEFCPNRFLDENGEFVKPRNFIPFSIGSRSCIGETLAKAEYFLFITTILQRFHLKQANPDGSPINEEPARSGQFLIAHPYKIRITERFSRQQSIMAYQETLWEDI